MKYLITIIVLSISILGCATTPSADTIKYSGKKQVINIIAPKVSNVQSSNIESVTVTDTTEKTPSKISNTVTINKSELPIVTVFDFTYEGISEMESEFFVDYLGGALFDTNHFRLIDRTQREQILSEIQFSLSGCTDETCQLEAGKLIAADYMVVGSLGKMGSRYMINAKLIQIETGETVTSARNIYDNIDMLVEGCEAIAVKLSSL